MYLSSASSRLLLYNTNNWELKKSYGCYDGLMRDVSWSDDGKHILQVNSKGMIEILSPADHEIRSLQHIPLKDTWAASFHRDGHHNIAIGTKSGNVVIWDTKNKSITNKFPAPSQQSRVDHLSYNSRNSSLAATMQNGETILYGLDSNIPVDTVKLHCSKSISAMKFHHDSISLLGLATYEGHVFLRDITTNKDKAFFENVHAAPVSDFAYSLINKDVVLSSGYDKVLHIYDVRLQNVVSSVCTTHILTSLTVNINNEVAIGTKNGSILVYDFRDYSTPIRILQGHNQEVTKVAFQPVRGKSLSTEVSLREDRDIKLTHTPQKIQSPIKNRSSDIFSIADTPTSSHVDVCPSDSKATDSFIVMLGLDNTETELNDFDEKTSESENNCNKPEARSQFPNIEKNLTKMSTNATDSFIVMLGLDNTETELNDFDEKTSESENNCNKPEARSQLPNIEKNLTKMSTKATDSFIVMLGLDNTETELNDFDEKTSESETNCNKTEARSQFPNIEKNLTKMSTKATDSFIVMLGLDNTETELNDFDEKTSESENNCNKPEARSQFPNIEKNLTKMSTPITDKIIDSPHFPSPGIPNGDESVFSNISIPKQMEGVKPILDTNTLEELKDFIKLTVSDSADDNRNNFLHIMMVLTEQKIFLEKQLTAVNEQLVELTRNQRVLLEANTSLSFEIDQLKILVNNKFF